MRQQDVILELDDAAADAAPLAFALFGGYN